MKNRLLAFVLPLVLLLLLAACAGGPSSRPITGASITGITLQETAAGTRFPFTILVTDTRQPIGVDFRGSLIDGSVRVELVDLQRDVLWQEAVQQTGPFIVNRIVTVTTPGTYNLGLAWDGPVQATYSLEWQPGAVSVPEISPLALLGGAGMVLVALSFLIFAWRRALPGRYLLFGAIGWGISVALKYAWALPANAPVYRATRSLPPVFGDPLFYVYVGALTGVFEVGMVYIALRFTRLGFATWKRALAFGIGFGALEALLLGLGSLLSVSAIMSSPASVPTDIIAQVAQANSVLFSLAPISERFFTILVHIFSSVLIFYSLIRRRPGAFWLAFVLKTGLDTVAAYAQIRGINGLAELWIIEGIIALFGLLSWIGTQRVRQRYPADTEVAEILAFESRRRP